MMRGLVTRRGWLINCFFSFCHCPPARPLLPITMPECKECIASGKQAQHCHHAAQAAGHDFTLQGLALDATNLEAAQPKASQLAKDGLVYDLDTSCTIRRGQTSNQTPVFPPMLCPTLQNPNPPLLTTLHLEKITYTHRAIILHFGTLFFMVIRLCTAWFAWDWSDRFTFAAAIPYTHPCAILSARPLGKTS
jgi:hypothetical protein